jgi:hypothetical protein
VTVYASTGSLSPNTFVWPVVGVTVIARAVTVGVSDDVEDEYAVDAVGVNVADNDAIPRSMGTQSQMAVVDGAATASQPVMDTPPSMKFTVPARDVVAVTRLVIRYCGELLANAKLTVVEA